MKKQRERETVCRYSIEGLERLRKAILLRAVTDWKIYIAKYAYAKRKRNRNGMERNLNEMRQVVYFISSPWFKYLTNYSCPAKECINKLLSDPVIARDKSLRNKIVEGIINI